MVKHTVTQFTELQYLQPLPSENINSLQSVMDCQQSEALSVNM